MLEENKMDYEKDICCPSSIAPSEEAIKDEDCKNCLIRSTCCYLNSDAPKSKKSSLCNKVMDSYLKTLRAEVELERKQQQVQKDIVPSSSTGVVYRDTEDLIDELLGMPPKTPEQKIKARQEREERRARMMEFDARLNEIQKERAKEHHEFMEHVSEVVDNFVAEKQAEKKLHDLMHQETDVEADRQHVRVKPKKNTDNN